MKADLVMVPLWLKIGLKGHFFKVLKKQERIVRTTF